MIPFFVVDRPMSLNIIKTFFAERPRVPFGLMTHALVTQQFRELYAAFPCDKKACWLRDDKGPCRRKTLCAKARQLRESVVRAVDCGIYADGRLPAYPKLFELYEEMGADYGIMKDVIGDARKTLESAKRAVDIYRRQKRGFQLVLVAQGSSAQDYVDSSRKLTALGIGRLAIGGLLTRKERSARYACAGTRQRMEEILAAVRKAFPKRWLFVLGCYHPKRHALFDQHGIYGSDYKGWIFNYTHRLDRLAELHGELLISERVLRPKSPITRRAAQRSRLWQNTQLERTKYATTKNTNPEQSKKKASHRQTFSDLLDKVERMDQQLAELRHLEAVRDGLPTDYKSRVADYRRLVATTDQEVRVQEVHRYLADQIVPQLPSPQITVERADGTRRRR